MATVTIKMEDAGAALEDVEIEQDYSVKSLKDISAIVKPC